MPDDITLPRPTLVVGDIHNRIEKVDAILEQFRERHRSVVFVGDYFDSYDDCAYDARRTARWLYESVQAPNRIHLLGNHDVSYLYPGHPQCRCPGWTPSKARVIAEELASVPRDTFRLATTVGPWLVSHAGFSRQLADGWAAENALIEAGVAQVCLGRLARYALLNGDVNRGGMDSVSGILWTDFGKTFEPVPGINQIVGHTPAVGAIRGKHIDADGRRIDSVVYDNRMRVGPGGEDVWGFRSVNWCLDCDLEMVALIDGDSLQFLRVD